MARQAQDQARPTAQARGYDATWRRLSRQVLAREPVCRMCGVSWATLVDHIRQISAGGPRLDPANLQPLCRPCHGKKTAADQARYHGGLRCSD